MFRIREAESKLADAASGLNPAQYAEAQRAIDAEKRRATAMWTDKLNELAGRISGSRQARQKEICEVRDALRALTKEGRKGHMNAADFTSALSDLEERLTTAEAVHEDEQGDLAQLQEVEEGPANWADFNDEPWSASDYYDSFLGRMGPLEEMVETTHPAGHMTPDEARAAAAAGAIYDPRPSQNTPA